MVNLGSSCKPNTGTELIEFSGLQFADPGDTKHLLPQKIKPHTIYEVWG